MKKSAGNNLKKVHKSVKPVRSVPNVYGEKDLNTRCFEPGLKERRNDGWWEWWLVMMKLVSWRNNPDVLDSAKAKLD